jgi:FixJ family two-component response regulator
MRTVAYLFQTGESTCFPCVRTVSLDYAISSRLNETVSPDLRLLVAGDLPAAAFGPWRAELSGPDLAGDVRRISPDILVMDAALATVELAGLLGEMLMQDLPVVLVTGEADADAAGLLIERRIELVEKPASAAVLRAAIDRSVERRAADAGGAYLEDRLAALRRDAERVAAALQEMTGAATDEAVRPVTPQRVRAHIRARRLREKFFAPGLFADAAWDILLDLAASRLERKSVSVSSLCIAASVPTTTALRTIKQMVDQALLVRRSDPGDARRTFIDLAPQTARAMDGCLEAVLNQPGL